MLPGAAREECTRSPPISIVTIRELIICNHLRSTPRTKTRPRGPRSAVGQAPAVRQPRLRAIRLVDWGDRLGQPLTGYCKDWRWAMTFCRA
jgi:hypothetical protein